MKKGFTLIELLAVIVILAVIALISVPLIINVIDKAKKGAFEDAAYGIISAAEHYYANETLDGREVSEKIFNYPNDTELKYKGTKPKGGTLIINSEGQVKLSLHDGTYCVTKEFADVKVTIREGIEDCGMQLSYTDDALNGSDPELDEGMIPVIIENNGTVKKANINKKWYDYNNKEWANAVLVSSDVRNSYNNGDIIPENKILAYFVWIPRYKYAIPSGSGAREINITFENKTISKSNGTAVGTDYYTHPAFTFGTTELNGIWVGKFETTGTEIVPSIKPNLESIEYQKVREQFETSLIFGNRTLNTNGTITNNANKTTYGLNSESRMMKNTEWGAVAYLSHSKYGKNSQVRVNNNYKRTTGCGASVENGSATSNCEIAYGSATEYPQSTTGNITGIFDMSGGAWEYVLGVMKDASGNPFSGYNSGYNSGFNGGYIAGGSLTTGVNFPNSKYYDAYAYGTTTNDTTAYNRAILGDATKETKGWYNDYAYLVDSTSPWFFRGGDGGTGIGAGIFNSYTSAGADDTRITFRVVISL